MSEIEDRVSLEALRAEFTDAGMMSDYGRLASLFTEDGAWRMPHIPAEFTTREEIHAAVTRLRGLWEFFVQNTHPGALEINGDTATGRVYIVEFGRLRDGSSHMNYAIYHDRYQRTAEGWRFAERVYEVRYLDSTPLPGTVPVS